ncbi:MAG: trypsin-like peptidase domain-containing protein [Bacteroidetes bacterium]|nr:trypsin-like peptidase domain-containing protein [Bacteroidota bacterium]
MNEDVQILEMVERYLLGEMSPEERAQFEAIRALRPEVDQLVVEHGLFLRQVDEYGDRKSIKSFLHDTQHNLELSGDISTEQPKVRFMTDRYKRVFFVAASIAGLTALAISGIVSYFTPKGSTSEIALLKRELNLVKKTTLQTQHQVNNLSVVPAPADNRPVRPSDPGKFGGTGFLIDGRGYLVTSAHVVAKADSVYISNAKGEFYKTKLLHLNNETDIAILKIVDDRFTALSSLPYSLRTKKAELGEPIFTLGFPRTEIVYNEGYLSAKTGFNGDTTAYQVSIAANPGNSGGPIFNHNGEIIGVLSGKQTTAEGAVFTSLSKNILRAIDSLKTDSSNLSIHLPLHSSLRGVERVQQIKQIESCVFNVMSF